MKYVVAFVTTPGRAVSERLSKGLVEGRLAACVNRVPGIISRYRWKGKIETAREELLIIKSRKDRLSKLVRWVKAHHPYTVCEVITLPITGGNLDYLRWIDQSLR